MQVTSDRTTVDLPADSVQFSVRFDGECLIGQYGPASGGYHGAVAPAARHRRRCLVGADPPHRLVGDMAEYIYSMVRARKAVGDKLILDDVTMSFLPGAKIGVVGPNGAGKSTILKIMAGLDTPVQRRGAAEPRLHGRHPACRSRRSTRPRPCSRTCRRASATIKAKIDRFNEISLEMAEPDADFDALLAEMGTLQEAIDAADAWDLDSQLEQAMDALRCPPRRRAGHRALRW